MAFLLAGFTLLSGVIFHGNFTDQIQMIMFLKNLGDHGSVPAAGAWGRSMEP